MDSVKSVKAALSVREEVAQAFTAGKEAERAGVQEEALQHYLYFLQGCRSAMSGDVIPATNGEEMSDLPLTTLGAALRRVSEIFKDRNECMSNWVFRNRDNERVEILLVIQTEKVESFVFSVFASNCPFE